MLKGSSANADRWEVRVVEDPVADLLVFLKNGDAVLEFSFEVGEGGRYTPLSFTTVI
jgi:hypothetical protein